MRTVTFSFKPSVSVDVVAYNIIIENSANGGVLYDKALLLSEFTVNDITGNYELVLNSLSELDGFDGVCTITVFAVDDAGNPSPDAVLEDVELDFLAPDAPTDLRIVRS